VDPGLKCTAVVLTRNYAVKEAVSFTSDTNARDGAGNLINQHRVHDMSLTLRNTLQGWIDKYDIKTLYINIELPILNRNRGGVGFAGKKCAACGQDKSGRQVGVTTMMTQMRMIAVYQNVLYELNGAEILLGEVNPSTAKLAFTGRGDAGKAMMIDKSVWSKRPDVKDREHLADAQGIARVLPAGTVTMHGDDRYPRPLRYNDGAVGTGPDWLKKPKVTVRTSKREAYNKSRRQANKKEK